MSRANLYKQADVLKGAANHRRVEILYLLENSGGMTTDEIVADLETNYQTGAHHVRKLVESGLVKRWQQGRHRMHDLTPVGEDIMTFLKTL